MCCVASSDDSKADAFVSQELPLVHMLSSGESHTYNMHAHLINLQLQADIAGPSEPLQVNQSGKVVIQEPHTAQGKRRIKISEKARYVLHMRLTTYC
jgi:hypothetical protein